MTQGEAAKMMAMLDLAFPNFKSKPGTFELYERILLKFDHDAAREAIETHIATAKFFPTIAELLDAIAPAGGGVALEQWGHLCRAISDVGSYQPAPRFRDPVTAHCVATMGWKELCRSVNDVADRARFCELYGQVASRDRLEQRGGQSRTLEERRVPRLLAAVGKDLASIGGGR